MFTDAESMRRAAADTARFFLMNLAGERYFIVGKNSVTEYVLEVVKWELGKYPNVSYLIMIFLLFS